MIPFMTLTLMTTGIIIIGAGPSGLAALKTLLSTSEVQNGLWTPRVFEASSDLGGVWHPTPDSPIYEGLTTNLPHPIMGFPSFPFPPSTPLFPPADTVQQYLLSYGDHFALRKHIAFNARVEHVIWDNHKRQWRITVRHSTYGTVTKETHTCALLLVCNGHHNTARIPSLPGLSELLSSGYASHSQTYHSPAALSRTLSSLPTHLSLSSSTILIVGSGPSGQDISSALSLHAKRIVLSTSKPIRIPSSHQTPTITHKPRTSHFVSKTAFFEDGSCEDIDYVILATGYRLSFPFFSSSPSSAFTISSTTPIPTSLPPHPQPILSPLTLTPRSSTLFPLARHLFGLPSCGFSPSPSPSPSPFKSESEFESEPNALPPPTSLAFLGLLVRVAPLPIVEAQARAIVAVFRASFSPSPSISSNSNSNNSNNANTNPTDIDWTHEHDLIRDRHALLCSSFSQTSTPTASASTSSTSNHQPSKTDTENKTKTKLQTHLSSTWDIFSDSLAQFTYRDSLDDLCSSLTRSTSTPISNPTPTQTQTNIRVRVKPWEIHFYENKDALRQGWRLLEERGLAEEWVRGIGSGNKHKGGEGEGEGKTPEEEWVALMNRVLRYWEDECLARGRSEGEGEDTDGGSTV